MKKVLVVYFSQSGQLHKAVQATLELLVRNPDVAISYENLQPKTAFPFPWSYMQFFDAFPETVQGRPCELQPFGFNASERYDLVILAYQPWFLSLSIPMNSFLQSSEAGTLLNNTNVVTIIACRNMWLTAQEKMKHTLKNLNARLVGNITFVDKSANLVSLVSVLAFALGGVKNKFLGIFPKYGVSDSDLVYLAPEFGRIVNYHLGIGEFTGMQEKLISKGAINIKPNLMIMEGRGKVIFPLYANYISKRGTAKSEDRRARVRIFGIVLPLAIFILSPLITLVSRLVPLIFTRKIKRAIDYHSGIALDQNESIEITT